VCEGRTDVCEPSVTHKPLSTTIHDTVHVSQTRARWGREGEGEILRGMPRLSPSCKTNSGITSGHTQATLGS
jgi:hypothetical protein